MITNELLQPDEEQQPQWSDLPPECRREVLLRLSDPRDIEASSEACEHLAVLAQEQRIWRELAQYHFTPQQIATTRQNNPGKDWKTIFTIARRLVELFCARIKSRECYKRRSDAWCVYKYDGVLYRVILYCSDRSVCGRSTPK